MDLGSESLKMDFTLRDRVILYPQFAEALDWIRFHHRRAREQKRGDGMMIIGCSGVGKSTLIEAYQKQYGFESIEGTSKRVLVIRTPEVPTAKMLVEQMLYAIGDPASHSGSLTSKTERLKMFIQRMGVEMLVFDEFQHFVIRANRVRRGEAEDWLKNLISALPCAVVLVGTPECEQLLENNPQLGRRFSQRIELASFTHSEDSLDEFTAVLKMLERNMPGEWRETLTNGDVPLRMLYASCGIIDYVIKLLEGAHYLSQLERDPPSLELLSKAFRKFIWRKAHRTKNPFDVRFRWSFLTNVGEPFHSIRDELVKAGLTNNQEVVGPVRGVIEKTDSVPGQLTIAGA